MTTAFEQGKQAYNDFISDLGSNLDNPYCVGDSRYEPFAAGIDAAREAHQVSIN